jgi:hypothetical protein
MQVFLLKAFKCTPAQDARRHTILASQMMHLAVGVAAATFHPLCCWKSLCWLGRPVKPPGSIIHKLLFRGFITLVWQYDGILHLGKRMEFVGRVSRGRLLLICKWLQLMSSGFARFGCLLVVITEWPAFLYERHVHKYSCSNMSTLSWSVESIFRLGKQRREICLAVIVVRLWSVAKSSIFSLVNTGRVFSLVATGHATAPPQGPSAILSQILNTCSYWAVLPIIK